MTSTGNTNRLIGYFAKRFLTEYLQTQRNCSPNTIAAYRDTISLFLRHIREKKRVQPERATSVDINAANVIAFLNDIQANRGNCAATRNARLAAIRAFVRYILFLEPTLSSDLQSVLAIPIKRMQRKILGYLTHEELDALIDSPDDHTWSGKRDRVLFLSMYNSGARVSEIIGVKVFDLQIGKVTSLRLHGKGRKERVLPLWKKTSTALKRWIEYNKPEHATASKKGCDRIVTRIGCSFTDSPASISRKCPEVRLSPSSG